MRPKKISDQDILEVTRLCLLEQGVGVSTNVIAERLGVSQATLFKRFGTKIKLLQMALWLPIRSKRFIALLETPPTEEPVLPQLHALCMQMLKFYDEMLPCWSVLQAGGIKMPEHLSEKSNPIKARLGLTRWISILQEERRIRSDVDPESVAVALIGVMMHRPMRKHILHDKMMKRTDEEYINSTVNVLWQGMAPMEEK